MLTALLWPPRNLRAGLAVCLALGLTNASAPAAKADTMTTITEETAAAQVAAHYTALFENLRIVNPLDGTPVPLPPLTVDDFTVTGEDDVSFHVAHDPLTGPIIRARISKTGGLVHIDPIVLAVE